MRAFVLLLLAGCAGPIDPTPTSAPDAAELAVDAGSIDASAVDASMIDAGTTSCTLELAGPVAGTFGCEAVGAWQVAFNSGSISLSMHEGTIALSSDVRFIDHPMAGHYRDDDDDVSGGIELVAAGEWEAKTSVRGNFDIEVEEASITSVDAEGNRYHITGSVTAILDPVPGSGAIGSIDLVARFD